MALDKLVDGAQLDADLTSVANAIRTKGGTSAQLAFPAGFVNAVDAIPTGGTPSEVVINLWEQPWEVGAVQGDKGKPYNSIKQANPNRLRGVNLFKTGNLPFTLSANFGSGEWVVQYQLYDETGTSISAFTVIAQDTELPTAPYIALVVRHSNGNLPMYVEDIQTIKPKLSLDLSWVDGSLSS